MKMTFLNYLCHVFLLTVCFLNTSNSEVFTALTDLEDLLETEGFLIKSLDSYLEAEEHRLDLLRRYASVYGREHAKASEDVQTYVANPINAYILVKRMTSDWQQVEKLMGANLGADYLANITLIKENMKFPSDEDLNGAAVALTRLQDTYQLETSSLARGELNGVKYSLELTAADCFELGRQSYNNGDFYHTILWMKEADLRSRREANQTTDRSDILEYLAFSTFKQGNVPLALDLTNKLLDIMPTHERAIGNKIYYESELEKSKTVPKKGDDGELDEDVEHPSFDEHEELYKKLCRGEVRPSIEITSRLKCFYYNNSKPFLLIAPFKAEEAYPDPYILIFHDVLSNDEISLIQSMSVPRFRRATVQNPETGELEIAKYRISKSAWLKDHEHPYIARISQRLEDMTGLTMETAEELQVANYGIGGHYDPHYDCARKGELESFKSGIGNRIATVLFYMSDVAQGGATVFPHIFTALWPQKGSAAFWHNLHTNGEGDVLTRHAACPVLAGSKWVSNKWIHERGQEFLRPCGLEPPPEERTI